MTGHDTHADTPIDRRLSIAPMLDWTDRHERYFLRLITKRALLFTEMVVTSTLIHGDRARFLRFHETEHPVAIQLGGSDPHDLAQCSKWAAEAGYDEINLNVGCPSDRVSSGAFGACLMAEPQLVADCVKAMQDAVPDIPVTVKHRIGIDDLDSYDHMLRFVDTVADDGGCRVFYVHARKAWLQGLSPKENREKPPLRYDEVYRLKRERPELEIILNGGVMDMAQSKAHLEHVDGVMIGRAAYEMPYDTLATADRDLYDDAHPIPTRHDVLDALIPYIEAELAEGNKLSRITKHLMGLFHGLPGARSYRRHLTEAARAEDAGIEVVREAMAMVGTP